MQQPLSNNEFLPASSIIAEQALTTATATATKAAVTTSTNNNNTSTSNSTITDPDLIKIQSLITSHPNFPKPGIIFYDIFPIFRVPDIAELLYKQLVLYIGNNYSINNNNSNKPRLDIICGLDSRGFLLGPIIANRLGLSFIPIRKVGKLPGRTISNSYNTEYSTNNILELQLDSITSNKSILLIDDLLATGGTLLSAISLIQQCKSTVIDCLLIIELIELNGRKLIEQTGSKLTSLFKY